MYILQIIRVVLGKHKPIYDPSMVMGDYIIVTNIEHMQFTGKKRQYKLRRYVCVYTYVHVYACIYTHIYMCVYVCVCICMYKTV
jgi:ribosomal protein L13